MPAPRKPTQLLELNGAFKHDPQRAEARKHEPRPDGPLGDPPDGLDELEIACWGEYSTQAYWLTVANRGIVEIASRLRARMREMGIGGRKGLSVGELSALIKCEIEMGLSPVSQSKVHAPQKKEPESPFSKIKARLG